MYVHTFKHTYTEARGNAINRPGTATLEFEYPSNSPDPRDLCSPGECFSSPGVRLPRTYLELSSVIKAMKKKKKYSELVSAPVPLKDTNQIFPCKQNVSSMQIRSNKLQCNDFWVVSN